MTNSPLGDVSDEELREMYDGFVLEAREYVVEQRAAGLGISLYGRDLLRLLKMAKAEMLDRDLLDK